MTRTGSRAGLTRIEALGIGVGLVLLAGLVLPTLANHGDRSSRLICVGNLRQMGQAIQQWSTDHENRVPWRTHWCEEGTTAPVGTAPCVGSTPPVWFNGGLYHNSWFHWFWLSNQLGSPRILACPADTARTPAVDWSTSTNGGFLSGNYRHNAVSYFLGLDAIPENPVSLVAGDLNLRFATSAGAGACSSGIRYNASLPASTPSPAMVPGVHGEAGNFLLLDGRVEQLSSRGLHQRYPQLFGFPSSENGWSHYLIPN